MRRAVFAGSFDPVTLGHMGLIRRAAALFDELIVAVLVNVHKQGLVPMEDRLHLLQTACETIPNVRIESFSGLLVDFAKKEKADVLVRGLRNTLDFEQEKQLASANALLCPGLDTVFLMSDEDKAVVSSSQVREILYFGGNIEALVPACVYDYFAKRSKGGKYHAQK